MRVQNHYPLPQSTVLVCSFSRTLYGPLVRSPFFTPSSSRFFLCVCLYSLFLVISNNVSSIPHTEICTVVTLCLYGSFFTGVLLVFFFLFMLFELIVYKFGVLVVLCTGILSEHYMSDFFPYFRTIIPIQHSQGRRSPHFSRESVVLIPLLMDLGGHGSTATFRSAVT